MTPEEFLTGMTGAVVDGRKVKPSEDPLAPDGPDAQGEWEHRVRVACERQMMRLPSRYRTALLTDLKPEQQPTLIRAWLEHPDAQTLILAGDNGTGKTYAAAAVANATAARGLRAELRVVPARWWTVAQLLDELRPSSEDCEGRWRDAKAAPLVVLDDLGHTRPTEWAVERLWMLIDHRVTNGLRQVLTTNASWKRLVETWGPATLDRLYERSAIIKMTGKSRRRPLDLGGRL
jgi:DNA replication protein DnaC